MKQSLQLKLSQHLTLTPQLQQSIRLLQLSTLELNQELDRFLMENPLLERTDLGDLGEPVSLPPSNGSSPGSESAPQETRSEGEPELDSHNNEAWDGSDNVSFDETANYGPREEGEEREGQQLPAVSPTLQDYLISQLNLMQLSERDKQLVILLIAHLDEDGYLTATIDEIFETLPEDSEVDPEELSIALKHLQHLDPAGVGARSLSECLELQINTIPANTPARDCAMAIAKNHLQLLASRDFNKLRKVLSCNEADLKAAQQLVQRLNPKPGARFSNIETRFVVPDVIVRKLKGKWSAMLNQEALPKLRINKMYADILQSRRDGSNQQLTSQLQEARWLIKNVQQRFDTILRVTQAIVDRQKHFFDHGEVAMRPLVLREIAEHVGLHESTVSRVTTQKYMLTPRGIFELKYFFGSHVATETGGACSATAIRALIKQLVSAEDTKKPLSDSRIADILAQQGIMVARRTVAKYREAMQIQPANLRKSL
ncbi:MAG TPA: RNA polymerase factor sigma-54 [Burkholderiales bacterium]|nr:RNA polymerase factor sigma-54 [Burkholderiales bacterium]